MWIDHISHNPKDRSHKHPNPRPRRQSDRGAIYTSQLLGYHAIQGRRSLEPSPILHLRTSQTRNARMPLSSPYNFPLHLSDPAAAKHSTLPLR